MTATCHSSLCSMILTLYFELVVVIIIITHMFMFVLIVMNERESQLMKLSHAI